MAFPRPELGESRVRGALALKAHYLCGADLVTEFDVPYGTPSAAVRNTP